MNILDNIVVVDWSAWHAGPSCAAMLADLGADVVHVEQLGRGDAIRGLRRTGRGTPLMLAQGRHAIFEDLNRNKRGIAVDLDKEKGKEILYRLVRQAAVFVTNFRAKAALKQGLDYETLSAMNPRLVYAYASAFGERGPEADSAGNEFTAQAISGAMLASGEDGMPPVWVAGGISDRATGVYLAYGILAALFARERFGIGQLVTTSQLGAMVALQSATVAPALLTGKEPSRPKRSSAPNPIFNHYQCKGGRWIAFACVQGDRYWPDFCKGLGVSGLEHDPRFENSAKREQNAEELVALLDREFSTRTYEEWEHRFKDGVDIPFVRVNAIADLGSYPQALANDYVIDFEHPALGKVQFPGFPVRFSKTPASLRTPAPELGQDTESVLLDLGYSWDDIVALRDEEVI